MEGDLVKMSDSSDNVTSNDSGKVSGNCSGSCSSEGPIGRYYVEGIPPEECWCGKDVRRFSSRSGSNPYRRYFRCERAATYHLVNDNHVWKWMDEAFYEELKKINKRLKKVDEEMQEMRTISEESIKEVHKFEYDLVNHFVRNDIDMERRWKKNMIIMCSILVIFVCVMKLV